MQILTPIISFFLLFSTLSQTQPIEIDFEVLLNSNLLQETFYFSNVNGYLSLNNTINLNKNMNFINSLSNQMEFRFLNEGKIVIEKDFNISFTNFKFLLGNNSNNYAFNLQGTKSLILQVFLFKKTIFLNLKFFFFFILNQKKCNFIYLKPKNCSILIESTDSSFLLSNSSNQIILNGIIIENSEIISKNPSDSSFVFDFIQTDNIIISNFSLKNNIFHKKGVFQANYSMISMQNSEIIDNFFININGFLGFNSSIIFENNTIHNNSFDQNLFHYMSCSSCFDSFFLTFRDSNFSHNKGNSLISINSRNFAMKLIDFHLENVYFFSEIYANNIISASNLISLNLTKLVLKQCASQKAIDLYNIDKVFVDEFFCLTNKGSCLNLYFFNTFYYQNSHINNCSSQSYTPGLQLQNSDEFIGDSLIISSIFARNSFISTASGTDYLGCALFLTDIQSFTLKNSYFDNNLAYFPNNFYGGPALVFFNEIGSVLITECLFSNSKSLKNSLSFEFKGYNLTITNSRFLENIQPNYSFNDYTAIIVQGNTNYLLMKNCVLDKNFASNGLIFMSDKDFTIIELDKVHVIHNSGYYTSGIYICTETTNKTITWRNSLFYASLNNTQSITLYLYVPNIIDNFIMKMINVTMSKNIGEFIIPSILLKTDYVAILWGYTKNIYMEFTDCNFDSNERLNPMFTAYGIEKYLRLNLTSCSFYNNDVTFFLISDHAKFGLFDSIFVNNSWSLGHIMYASATESNFSGVIWQNDEFFNYEIFLFSDYSNAVFYNIFFNETFTNQNVFLLINMNSTIIKNIKINNLMGDNFMLFVNSTIDSIDQIFIMNCFFLNDLINLKSSVITKFNGLFLEGNDFSKLLSISERSQLFINNIYGKTYKDLFLENILFQIDNSIVGINEIRWNLSYIPLKTTQISIKSSTFSMNDSIFIGFSPEKVGIFFISAFKSNFFVNYAIMKNFTQWMFIDSSSSEIQNSSFFYSNSMKNTQNSILNLFIFTNNLYLNISHTNFSKLECFSNPILIQNSLGSENIEFFHCRFLRMSSKNSNGGAIYVENSNILLRNSIFVQNSAIQGGAIYLFCSFEFVNSCNFSLNSNIFLRNSAEIDGGALKWKYSKPIEQNNTYLLNKASYSSDFSGYFCKIGFEFYTISEENTTRSLNFSSFRGNSNSKLRILNVTSNNAMQNILKLYPLDSYNQIVYESITNRVDLSIISDNSSSNATNCEDKTSKIFGKTSQFIDVSSQSFVFDYIIINSCQNKTVHLNFSTNISSLPLNLYWMPNSLNEMFQNTYSLIIPLEIRQCFPGEIFNKLTNQCEECMENYYSFDINDADCALCPSSAYCPGYNLIILDENYWRADKNSSSLYKCNENVGNCLGGFDSNCLENYKGILCNNCIGDLKKNFIGECKECPNDFVNFVANFFFFMCILLIFVKVLNYFEREDLDNSRKFIAIQFIHYVHFLVLTQKFSSNAFRSSLEIYITFRSSMWFSLDCFVLMATKTTDFFVNNLFKTLYLYWGFLLYLVIFWVQQRKQQKKQLVKPLFLFFYCTYPFFLCFFFENIVCKEINGDKVLILNTAINCSEGYYIGWAFFFFLPNVLLFILIIPIYILFKHFHYSLTFIQEKKISSVKMIKITKRELLFKNSEYFFQVIKLDEFLRFIQKILLVFSRFSGLQEEDNDLVGFLILLVFFLLALKFEKHYNKTFRQFSLYILFIFLINCYFFVVLDFFYEYSVAVFFVIVSVFMKVFFYFYCVWRFLFRRNVRGNMIKPNVRAMKNIYQQKSNKEPTYMIS